MARDLPPLLHLTADEVRAAMPPIDERLRLAERTMTALATEGAAELPSKIGIHPRPDGSFAHAMPAHLRARDVVHDLVGMKWVAGFAGNASRGLPAISAVVVLNDPETGLPIAILDGGPITAERTAAVSGTAIRHFAPDLAGRAPSVAIVGAGVQGHSHVAIVRHLQPDATIRVFDRHQDRAEALALTAGGPLAASTAASAREAVDGADIVITAAAFTTPDRRQVLTPDWLAPDALVVAVDYATMVSAAVADGASLFLVDHTEQFLANRAAGQFDGYPAPSAMLGAAILAGTPRPSGRVLVSHLGVGLADLVFGAAILERAREEGLGRTLPR